MTAKKVPTLSGALLNATTPGPFPCLPSPTPLNRPAFQSRAVRLPRLRGTWPRARAPKATPTC